ncbi:MAG: universal stress protein [Bacteroidota bacterium]
MSTIVAALDFSDGAGTALRVAADHAARTGAALHLFHADVLFDGVDSPSAEVHQTRIAAFAKDKLGAERYANLDPVVAAGRGLAAAPPILNYVASVGADLLVTGTHGRRGLRRLVLGSVASELLREAVCPVMVVPASKTTMPGPGAPVVAPLDFSALNEAALSLAVTWARTYGAPLHLVHIVELLGPYPEFYPESLVPSLAVGTSEAAEALAAEHDLEERAEAALREIAAQVRAEGIGNIELFVGYGHPDRRIDEHAAEHGAGLIVMATHGLTGFAHALVGSVTEKTVRRAPCAVLTVKAPSE